jgi:hypothetical protein
MADGSVTSSDNSVVLGSFSRPDIFEVLRAVAKTVRPRF